MTAFPAVDELPETSARALLAMAERMSSMRAPGISRWAAALLDALLARLSILVFGTVTESGQPVPLSALTEAELLIVGPWLGHMLTGDQVTDEWLLAAAVMFTEEYRRRRADQMLTDAVFDAHAAEEQRRDRHGRPAPDLSGIEPWSQVSREKP